VVALISGGKDSCYNMMHCVANGHQITALANLKPHIDSQKDELDSFLYQTVGHDAISYYAECMGLPLYRREILGRSLIQEADYKLTTGDETEDLFELLKEVKEANTDIQGVSVGLKPTHLGKSIEDLYPYLCSLNEKYDVHVCGEGGEYETFTLDCPLFTKRLHVEESEIIMHSDNAFAEVAYLRLNKLVVMDKLANTTTNLIKVPAWSDGFEDVLSRIEVFKGENVLNAVPKIDTDYIPETNNDYMDLYTLHVNSPYFAISGTTAYGHKSSQTTQSRLDTIEEETRVCMKNLEERLVKLGLNWTDVINMNVFIKDMNEFGRMNEANTDIQGVSV
ncbi:5245_t:CDS:10, partial [Cetraspora pellucida]